ncbi:MAG: hypothetical protein JNJ77_01780 [Planctomycetia bacterium]|nr:hypothetical protein [Planctomycetia bacterium]
MRWWHKILPDGRWRLLQLRWISLTIVLACSSCSDNWKPQELADYLAPISDADKVTLYSIDGKDPEGSKPSNKGAEKFHGTPVLGTIEIKDSQIREQLVQALLKNMQVEGKAIPACFIPRHGIRAEKSGKTTDYVICFECYQVEVYRNTMRYKLQVERQPQELLNRLLKEGNIPIAP